MNLAVSKLFPYLLRAEQDKIKGKKETSTQGGLVKWLVGWLVGFLVDWLVYWLVGWLVVWFAGWLAFRSGHLVFWQAS